jgi:hypothetical protein
MNNVSGNQAVDFFLWFSNGKIDVVILHTSKDQSIPTSIRRTNMKTEKQQTPEVLWSGVIHFLEDMQGTTIILGGAEERNQNEWYYPMQCRIIKKPMPKDRVSVIIEGEYRDSLGNSSWRPLDDCTMVQLVICQHALVAMSLK